MTILGSVYYAMRGSVLTRYRVSRRSDCVLKRGSLRRLKELMRGEIDSLQREGEKCVFT